MITAKDNPRIKKVSMLCSSAKKRREEGAFILEGSRLCAEALREDIYVKELFYTAEAEDSHPELIEKLSQKAEFYSEVSKAVFSKMSDTDSPQGVLLTVSLKEKNTSVKSGRWIAFERISDPSNLGAAARTAEALGFGGILLSRTGVDPYSPKSLRASMGALLRLPLVVAEDFQAEILSLKENGFTVTGTVVDADALKINNVSFGENEITVIGNEANGLTEEMKALCSRLVTIPMTGRAESLNAAAAAAIVMWEIMR